MVQRQAGLRSATAVVVSAGSTTGGVDAVLAANASPVASGQAINVLEDSPKAITLFATDADSDPLAYSVVTFPAHGILSGTPPDLTYLPAADYHGLDSLTFKASDGAIDSNVATVGITVGPVSYVLWTRGDRAGRSVDDRPQHRPGQAQRLSRVSAAGSERPGRPRATRMERRGRVRALDAQRSPGWRPLANQPAGTGAGISGAYLLSSSGSGRRGRRPATRTRARDGARALDAQRHREAALWKINPAPAAVIRGVYLNRRRGRRTLAGRQLLVRERRRMGMCSGRAATRGKPPCGRSIRACRPAPAQIKRTVYLFSTAGDRQAVAGDQLRAREPHRRLGVLWTRSDRGAATLWTIIPGTGAVVGGVYLGPASGIGAPWQATSHVAVRERRNDVRGRRPC